MKLDVGLVGSSLEKAVASTTRRENRQCVNIAGNGREELCEINYLGQDLAAGLNWACEF